MDSSEQHLFDTAASMSGEQRSKFLDSACGADEEMKQRIFALLYEHEEDGLLLDQSCDGAGEVAALLSRELGSAEPFSPPGVGADVRQTDGRTEVGTLGDYRLEEEIARGSMGVVFRAKQVSLNRTVAVKVIRTSLLSGHEEIARFRSEAEAAARLSHPNIIPIYEVGEADGQHFYSMPLVRGGTLAGCKDALRGDLRLAVTVVAKVARAIHVAHQNGILHRDIKPGNILIDAAGEPHVGDFGLAQEIGNPQSLTLPGQVLGTPHYMAPEQVEGGGDAPTTAVDVYALGAVLYEMITGQVPFGRDQLLATLQGILHDSPVPPRQIGSGIDRDLETVVLKCLEKDPAARYASADRLADDLDHWLAGEPVIARPVNGWARVQKWARRKPSQALLWGGSVVLVAFLAVAGPLIGLRQARLRMDAEEAGRKESEARKLAEDQTEHLEENLYFSEMNVASQMGLDAILRIRETTAKWIPNPGGVDRRGWEWHYLNALGRHELAVFEGHDEAVAGTAWHPEGTLIATVGADGGVRIWDAVTAVQHSRLGESQRFGSIAWSSDGRWLAAGAEGGEVLIWQPGSGRPPRMVAVSSEAITTVQWEVGGMRLAAGGGDGIVRVIDGDSGEVLSTTSPQDRVLSVAWSPEGRAIASGSGWMILRISDPGTGAVGVRFDPGDLRMRNLAWSPDGRWIAGASDDFSLVVIEAESGVEKLRLAGHYDFISSVAWDPEGARIATSSWDRTVRVWDFEEGKSQLVFPAEQAVNSVAWSPDGSRLVFSDGSRVRVCEAAAVDRTTFGAHQHWISSLIWDPTDRRILSTSGDGSLRLWDTETGVEEIAYRKSVRSLQAASWSADGSRIVAVGDGISLWDARSGEMSRQWGGASGISSAVAWAPGSSRFATLDGDGRVRIRSTGSEEVAAVLDPGGDGYGRDSRLAWSPDGSELAVTFAQGGIDFWSRDDWHMRSRLESGDGEILCLAWHPEGTCIAAGFESGRIEVLERSTGQSDLAFRAHSSAVRAVAWSPDGSRIASGGDDRMLRLWSGDSGAICFTVRAHDRKVTALVWSSDGSRIATGSTDAMIHIWDGRTRSAD